MRRHSVEDMLTAVLALAPGTRFSVIAPVVRGQVGAHEELLADLRRQGFARIAVDDEVRDLSETIVLAADKRHTIEVYVDRLVLKDGIRGRLADSFEVALRLTGGLVKVLTLEGQELLFSEQYADLEHGLAYPEITPSLFSFNSPDGACPECDGLGSRRIFDVRLLVPNEHLSLKEGALHVWTRRGGRVHTQALQALADHFKFDMFAAWTKLPDEVKVVLLQGSGDEPIPGLGKKPTPFEGVIPLARATPARGRDHRQRGRRRGRPARGGRGAHERGRLLRVQRPAPAPGGAHGQDRRPQHLRDLRLADRNSCCPSSPASSCRP
jgi:excinuclease ABC subunit A